MVAGFFGITRRGSRPCVAGGSTPSLCRRCLLLTVTDDPDSLYLLPVVGESYHGTVAYTTIRLRARRPSHNPAQLARLVVSRLQHVRQQFVVVGSAALAEDELRLTGWLIVDGPKLTI